MVSKPSVNEFPMVKEVLDDIESILRETFKEVYDRFVIRQDKGFIILPPTYRHLPPIEINVHSHPDDKDRVLFISFTRRIPISLEDGLADILEKVGEPIGVKIETLGKKDGGIQVKFVKLFYVLHAFSLRDKVWFLIILTSLISAEDVFFPDQEKKRKEFPKIGETEIHGEYT